MRLLLGWGLSNYLDPKAVISRGSASVGYSRKMNRLETDNPSILCIIPWFPPLVSTEALASAKMVMALINLGVDTKVIFTDKCYLPSSFPLLKYGCDSSKIWESLTDIKVGVGRHRYLNLLFLMLTVIRYRTGSDKHWIGGIVKQAKALHRDHSFDIVYSRSLPPIAHTAGYWCAKALDAVWVANINDPWDLFLAPNSQIKTFPLYALIAKYWLRKTLRSADLVTYPSRQLYDFHARLARLSHKAEIIPHVGYRINEAPQVDAFDIVHAGKLGFSISTMRSSKGLLTGVSKFLVAHPEARKLTRLTLVGENTEGQSEEIERQSIIKQLGLNDVVRSVGWVSYEQSLLYINSASVCILIEGNMKEGIFFPSKFVDYIVARKPVIALSPSIGVIADMVPTKGLVRADTDDHDAVAKALGDFYKHFRDGSLGDVSPSEEFVRQFEPQTVAKQFLEAVAKIGR